jgi:hypothetical protein
VCCAVVLILSKDFVRKQYPMEELQLLLEWRKQGSKATLLPVFLNLTWGQLNSTAKAYKAGNVEMLKQNQPPAAAVECSLKWDDEAKDEDQRRHWGGMLAELCRITGTRRDQVRSVHLFIGLAWLGWYPVSSTSSTSSGTLCCQYMAHGPVCCRQLSLHTVDRCSMQGQEPARPGVTACLSHMLQSRKPPPL